MAKFEISKGFEDFEYALSKLEDKSTQNRIAKMAIYDGAAPLISEIRSRIREIPTEKFRFLKEGDKMRSLSPQEKEQLAESFRISPIKDWDDSWSIKMGVEGYNSFKTNKYPNGVPNPLLLASIEKGSSVRSKHQVVRTTITARKGEVIARMKETASNEFKKLFTK